MHLFASRQTGHLYVLSVRAAFPYAGLAVHAADGTPLASVFLQGSQVDEWLERPDALDTLRPATLVRRLAEPLC